MEPEINSPEAIEALKFYTDMTLKYNIAAPPEKATKDRIAAFVNGNVACTSESPWVRGAFEIKGGPEFADNIGVCLPIKAKENGKKPIFTRVLGQNLFITKNSKNKEAAWELAEFMGSREAQQKMSEMIGNLPANIEAIESLKGDKIGDIYYQMLELEKKGEIVFGYEFKTEKGAEIKKNVIKDMVSSVAYGLVSAEEAANLAAIKMKKIFSE